MSSSATPPWPRFRGDAQQTGRAGPFVRRDGPGWTWPPLPPEAGPGSAARGIFNSPVIEADGTVWSGDASGRLSCVRRGDGTPYFTKGEPHLIDSTPLLLGDALYVARADGRIWVSQPVGAEPRHWFASAQPADGFINWFEGHLGVDGHGHVVAPCDNFRVYFIDPDDPDRFWDVAMGDQTWSLACTNDRQQVFFGNNAMPVPGNPRPTLNLYGLDSRYKTFWSWRTGGSVVASPAWHDGFLYVGSFDGTLYAFRFDPDTPPPTEPAWTFQTRDHLYASPAVLPDGTVIQAGCDGSIYALDGKTGELRGRYDTELLNPVRSSPAVDPWGRVWIGTGNGRLLGLDGTDLYPLHDLSLSVDGPRQAVNASPGLGPDGIAIGDSEGALHLVPWASVPQVPREPGGFVAPARQTDLVFTDAFGTKRPLPRQQDAPALVWPGDTLCFTLDAWSDAGGGRQQPLLGLLDEVKADWDDWTVQLSGDRRYVLVRLDPRFHRSMVRLNLSARWRFDPQRDGLRMWGGQGGKPFERLHIFKLAPALRCPDTPPETLWLQRIVMALPMLMPSYNQIGFESLVYCLGRVARVSGNRWLYWLTGCKPSADPNPETLVRFPLVADYDFESGTLVLAGQDIVSELNGFRTAMQSFELTCWLTPDGGFARAPCLRLDYVPADVQFYGAFLEALGMGDAQRPVRVLGSGDLRQGHARALPQGITAQGGVRAGSALVTCGPAAALAKETLSILLVDRQTGEPLTTDYSWPLARTEAHGHVHLELKEPAKGAWPDASRLKVVLMVNSTPVPIQEA